MNIHIIILILALPAVICVAMILQTWDRVDSIMVKYNIKYTGEKNNFFDFIRIIKDFILISIGETGHCWFLRGD